MMRPQSLALPVAAPSGVTLSPTWAGASTSVTVTWNDNSINESGFQVQRSSNGTDWTTVDTVSSLADDPNIKQERSYTDTTAGTAADTYSYRVVAQNSVGYGEEFGSLTLEAASGAMPLPLAPPTNLVGRQSRRNGTQRWVDLTWTDNSGERRRTWSSGTTPSLVSVRAPPGLIRPLWPRTLSPGGAMC